MTSPVIAYVGIGSNLKEPLQQVTAAVAALGNIPHTHLLRYSRWYGSKAIGPGDQPDYINGVAELETLLDAHLLLDALQAIEQAQGRERNRRWDARTLDLDLLVFGDSIIHSERLEVPHPRLGERAFVLVPLASLNPDLILPKGIRVGSLLDQLDQCSLDGLWPLELTDPDDAA